MATPKVFGARLQRYKDPQVIGSGVWYLMHLAAEEAAFERSPTKLRFAGELLGLVRAKFACAKCRKHCEDYCVKHPYQGLIERNDYEAFSRWVYDFHYLANSFRKDVPAEKYEDVTHFFRSDESTCHEDCGGRTPSVSGTEGVSALPIPSGASDRVAFPEPPSRGEPQTISTPKPGVMALNPHVRSFILRGQHRRKDRVEL